MKPICYHFHIFKNAGTTIEWILTKNFGKNALSIDTNIPNGIVSNETILDHLKKYPKTNSISSHQIRFPVPDSSNFQFLPILFLRHPIDRIFSIYYFQRRRKDADRPGIRKAKELNLNDYIKWNFTQKKFTPMKNFQTLFLSHHNVEHLVDAKDLETAMNNIIKCQFFGIVERFDESLVLGEEILREYFPKIDLSYVKQNVSEDRKGTLEEKIEKDKKELDESVWKELLRQNKFDLKLYEKAKNEFNIHLEKIENLNKKISDFKNRCNKKIDYTQKMRNLLKR